MIAVVNVAVLVVIVVVSVVAVAIVVIVVAVAIFVPTVLICCIERLLSACDSPSYSCSTTSLQPCRLGRCSNETRSLCSRKTQSIH